MKTPVLLNENGDITAFASVEEAESHMEPVDVRMASMSSRTRMDCHSLSVW
jgi:hypothetical protein